MLSIYVYTKDVYSIKIRRTRNASRPRFYRMSDMNITELISGKYLGKIAARISRQLQNLIDIKGKVSRGIRTTGEIGGERESRKLTRE